MYTGKKGPLFIVNISFIVLCLHVTGVIAFRSTPLFPTHISTAMRDLSALKLRIGHLPCSLKWKVNKQKSREPSVLQHYPLKKIKPNYHFIYFKRLRQNIMWGAEHRIILPQKQVYTFGAFSATFWHAGQRQPSVPMPSVNIEPFKFVIKLWLLLYNRHCWGLDHCIWHLFFLEILYTVACQYSKLKSILAMPPGSYFRHAGPTPIYFKWENTEISKFLNKITYLK